MCLGGGEEGEGRGEFMYAQSCRDRLYGIAVVTEFQRRESRGHDEGHEAVGPRDQGLP